MSELGKVRGACPCCGMAISTATWRCSRCGWDAADQSCGNCRHARPADPGVSARKARGLICEKDGFAVRPGDVFSCFEGRFR